MRSASWVIQVGPKCHHRCFYKRQAEAAETDTCSGGKARWRCSRDWRDVATSQVRLQPADAGRSRNGFSPGAARGSTHLPTPWPWTSNLQNWKRIHFRCFKVPTLWELVWQPQETCTLRKLLLHCSRMNLMLDSIPGFLKVTTHHLFIDHILIEDTVCTENHSGFQGCHGDQNRQRLLPSRSLHSRVRRQTLNKEIRPSHCPQTAQIKRQYEFNISSSTFTSAPLWFICQKCANNEFR